MRNNMELKIGGKQHLIEIRYEEKFSFIQLSYIVANENIISLSTKDRMIVEHAINLIGEMVSDSVKQFMEETFKNDGTDDKES